MSNQKVLIIEDDNSQVLLLEAYLETLSIETKSADNAEEGLKLLESYEPDLILSDFNLPQMNGLEMVEKIRTNKKWDFTPVIMISAQSDEKLIVDALDKGVFDFVRKPLRLEELRGRIFHSLRIINKEKELYLAKKKLEKEKIALSKYFSDDFLENLLNDEIDINLGGKIQEATIMFFDLRGSTGLAESMGSEKFSTFLSEVMNDLMELIINSNGSINKMIGDGILALFGCPKKDDKAALNALKAAARIREYFEIYNSVQPHGQEIGFGIGIATGKIFAGNIGSFRRMDYTVLGDAVNISSRLESLTKSAKVDVLIDGYTRKQAGSAIEVKKVEFKQVRGRDSELEIYYFKKFTE